jgi:hypothetical protein
MYGVDYSLGRPPVASLKAAGVTFACRYLSPPGNPKNLSVAEAGALLIAGIKLVLVWETFANRMLSGKPGGIGDAHAADAEAIALGLPGIPVYFACDWDATEGQQAAINGYLDGVASVIGHGRTGMYGGYWPVSRARAAGKASYYWGTVAWSGDRWDKSRNPATFTPHIMQGASVRIGGADCDKDDSNAADFGQWPRPVPPVPPAPAVITDGILVSKTMGWTGHRMRTADHGKTWTPLNP